MRSTPTRSWRGASADQRLAERRARLIEAGLEVIGTRGWAQTTVRAVCDQAGLTARYFYEAFGDRETLLLEVFDQVHREFVELAVSAVGEADDDAWSKARASLAAVVMLLVEDPRKGRVLLLEGVGDERLEQRRREAMSANAAVVAAVVQRERGTRKLDPVDIEVSTLAIIGAVAELAKAYLAGTIDISPERLIDHMTALHLAAMPITSKKRLSR